MWCWLRLLFVSALLVSFCGVAVKSGLAQEEQPILRGHVTEAGTGTRYSVDGQAVVCVPGVTLTEVARTDVVDAKSREIRKDCPVHVFGEPLWVFGTMKKKLGAVEATEVKTIVLAAVPVEGYALVDRVLTPVGHEAARVRADGYVLGVTPGTKVTFGEGGPQSLATVGTNVWARYAGVLGLDGVVAVREVEFMPNVVAEREDKLRQKTEFDPAAVTEEDRQGGLERAFVGIKGKKLPVTQDAAVQARVEKIGAMLVPAYQRQLPATDVTKIQFRFQVVDEPKLHWVLTQPSGVIQIPEHFISRMESDAQVAALLADAIAEVMEKQALRAIPTNQKLTAAWIAGQAAGGLVPGLGLATDVAFAKTESVREHRLEEQSSRTGLTFMEDAGLDVREAPVAWWRLADAKGKGLGKTAVPYRAEYLYGFLWRAGR